MSIKIGELIENNIKSKTDLEKLLDEKGISKSKERKVYINNFEKMRNSMKIVSESFLKKISETLQNINIIPKIVESISFNSILKPLSEIFTEISKKLEEVIPKKWVTKLLLELRKLKKIYMKKLIITFTLLKQQFFIYKNNKIKRMILFSEYILYLSSIFENYTKKIIILFKAQPKKLQRRIYREELQFSTKEFYDPVEMNFNRLFGYLFSITDNIKHEDSKFLKRFSKYTCLELLKESTELFLELKLFLKKSLVSFYILQVRLYH